MILFHRACALIWGALLVPSLLFWPESVAFVIFASVYANVKSDWGAAEAADDRRVQRQIALLRLDVQYLATFRR